MSLRTVALVLAALLAVPAALVLLRPAPPAAADADQAPVKRPLDTFWSFVPLVLLVALIALAAAE